MTFTIRRNIAREADLIQCMLNADRHLHLVNSTDSDYRGDSCSSPGLNYTYYTLDIIIATLLLLCTFWLHTGVATACRKTFSSPVIHGDPESSFSATCVIIL